MEIPDTYIQLQDSNLIDMAIGYIEGSSSEEEAAFHSSAIWDSVFSGEEAMVAVKFMNTDLLSPDKPDLTDSEILDMYKGYYTSWVESIGATAAYKDRKTINLGGKDFLREEFKFEIEDYSVVYGYYVRRIDENLVCLIEIQTEADSTEFFEEWFN